MHHYELLIIDAKRRKCPLVIVPQFLVVNLQNYHFNKFQVLTTFLLAGRVQLLAVKDFPVGPTFALFRPLLVLFKLTALSERSN